jgi:hypothetical protein
MVEMGNRRGTALTCPRNEQGTRRGSWRDKHQSLGHAVEGEDFIGRSQEFGGRLGGWALDRGYVIPCGEQAR